MSCDMVDVMSASVALINPKHARNVGTAVRNASCFADRPTEVMFTGHRVSDEMALLDRLPREERMKAYSEVPWRHVERPMDERPDLVPVAIELLPNATPLPYFEHPENALYVFGPEDGSIPKGIRTACHHFVQIPAMHCVNLAVAVALTLSHRSNQRAERGLQPLLELDETRGAWHTSILEMTG